MYLRVCFYFLTSTKGCNLLCSMVLFNTNVETRERSKMMQITSRKWGGTVVELLTWVQF